MKKLALTSIAVAAALFCGVAAAAPVPTYSTVALTPSTTNNQIAPTTPSGTVNVNTSGSVDGVQRSPWEAVSGPNVGTCDATCSTYKYTSVQANSSAFYDFGALGATAFKFMWGSPDDYNTLTLQTNQGQLIVQGDDFLANNPQAQRGFMTLLLDPAVIVFSALFSTTQNAFEYVFSVNQSALPVPLPGAIWLLLSALGGLVGVARLRTKLA